MPFTGAVAIINYKYIASANLRWKLGALANSNHRAGRFRRLWRAGLPDSNQIQDPSMALGVGCSRAIEGSLRQGKRSPAWLFRCSGQRGIGSRIYTRSFARSLCANPSLPGLPHPWGRNRQSRPGCRVPVRFRPPAPGWDSPSRRKPAPLRAGF